MLQPKRLLSLLLALVLVVSLLPAAAFAQDICAHQWEWNEDEDEGPFYQHCVLCDEEQKLEKLTGSHLDETTSWTLTPDGVLTVTGAGGFTGKGDLEDYTDYISALVIGSEVTEVYLPSNRFTSIASIMVDKNNPRLKAVDNVLFDVEENLLVLYPCRKTDQSYTVSGCDIGSYAFYGNKYLESVVIKEGTRKISSFTFSGCTDLVELYLPTTLEEVWRTAIPDSVETIHYAGNEAMWRRVYIHPDNELSDAEMVFGIPKSHIVPQWNSAHTSLHLKGDITDAALVLVSFYGSDGRLVKSASFSAEQVAEGVDITDDTVDLSACSAKIMVVNDDFVPVYDHTVPEGDVDYSTTAVFEGWLYGVSNIVLDYAGDLDNRPGDLLFSDGEQILVLDAAGASTPGYGGLGQKYMVAYNVQTNDLISMESAGVSVVGTALLREVECTFDADSETFLFTFGALKELPFDSDSIPYLTGNTYTHIKVAELADFAGSASMDVYTAIDRENDGDIDCLLALPVTYGQVTSFGTKKKYGDYMKLTPIDSRDGVRTYYLAELNGPDQLPVDLKKGDIVKLTQGLWDADESWEILPAESMTLERILLAKNQYTFDGDTFTVAENGWDLTHILTEDKLGDPFTVVCDDDLLVWAKADIIPLDVTKIYADGDEIDPSVRDAVELMYALGLMKGDGKNFNPNAIFTRAEMARLIYVILNYGEDDGAVNYRGANLFSDVEPDAWYEGYVNYCATIKLIQGTDGAFGPNEPVTCAKAEKMLLTAIGYSAEGRGYVGENWEQNVLSDAAIIDLLEDFTYSTAGVIPRQWVAKLVENCLLKCYTVDQPLPSFSGLLTGDQNDDDCTLMGEKYFDLTKDSEIYRSVYAEASQPDITVTAGLEELVDIDWDIFQAYLEETLDTTKYEVESVTISNPPRSATWGYLVTDGEKLTESTPTFHLDPTAKEYDLEDLHYQAGDKIGTHDTTFTLYYTAAASTALKKLDGVIRFKTVKATTTTLSGTIKAAKVMPFSKELSAFETLGGNDNTYITIDTLPTHGRLVYKFGKTGQEEVTAGMKFYLSSTAKRMLSDVTYVPAYSADKTTKEDAFTVTGFNAKRSEVKGTVKITIEHALRSVYFTDIADSYYADSVDFVKNQSISTGINASTFGLTGNVTRGQFVTFLYRAAGKPVVTDASYNFTDVSTSDYYYNAVMWAVSNGLVSGTTATTFAPADTLTRQQALTFLYRFAVHYLGRDGSMGSAEGITDYADVDAWAQNPVKWAAGHGFVGNGALEPKAVLDRGTTAVYLHGALTGISGGTGSQPDPDPEPTPDPEPATRTVLAYAISDTAASGALAVKVIGPNGKQEALYVTKIGGQPASDADFALPAFYKAIENADGEVSLALITGDFEVLGIYAGTVTKYTPKYNKICLNTGAELVESDDGFILYSGDYLLDSDALEDVEKKTPYLFYAPEEEAVYAIEASTVALDDLFVRLGGLDDTAAGFGDSYFIHPKARESAGFLCDLELMNGDGKNFNPEANVTRAELAKILYVILNYGKDDQGKAYTDLNLFTDTQAGTWYAGYVNYCASMGLMNGKADGTFAPHEPVTCPQVAKILLMALGYDAEDRGYVGANWSENVLADAAIVGLLDNYIYKVDVATPRQWLAVMIANALRNCYTYVGDTPVALPRLITKDIGAAKPFTYVLMGDKYFDLGLAPDLKLALLVDSCYKSGPQETYAVTAMVDGELAEYPVDPFSDTTNFIDDIDDNKAEGWGRLLPYTDDQGARTNVAAYTLDNDGLMRLYQTPKTFINLYEGDLEAGETIYYGDYTGENGKLIEEIKIRANKSTVFCYVDANRNVHTVTGCKNSFDVTDAQHGIRAMYAVATNIAEVGEEPDFSADMIVIETDVSARIQGAGYLFIMDTTAVDDTDKGYVTVLMEATGQAIDLPVAQIVNAGDLVENVCCFYEFDGKTYTMTAIAADEDFDLLIVEAGDALYAKISEDTYAEVDADNYDVIPVVSQKNLRTSPDNWETVDTSSQFVTAAELAELLNNDIDQSTEDGFDVSIDYYYSTYADANGDQVLWMVIVKNEMSTAADSAAEVW